MEVVVEHDYEAVEPDELTIHKGDVIKEVVQKPGGWWEGVLDDQRGLFPDNFVKALDGGDGVQLRNHSDVVRIRTARVVFSYTPNHEDELALKVGEIIDVVGEEEAGWWKGLLDGKSGVFPSNFVEEIVVAPPKPERQSTPSTDDVTPPLPVKPVKVYCDVQYAYKALNKDELTLNQGDVVTLLSKDGQDPGWWKGELNGVIGVFPDNFVTIRNSNSNVAIKTAASRQKDISSSSKTPPLPGKKPVIQAIRKSPSAPGVAGIFSELCQKLGGDKVDGAQPSKQEPPISEFDQVERRPLLHDVRATRVKAPGRRPPSTAPKDEDDLPVTNGEYVELRAPLKLEEETKPKLREWEKHKAPWLEEMKQSQAKRTSTSPSPAETTPPSSDMSKSMSALPVTPARPIKTSPGLAPKPISPQQFADLLERVAVLEKKLQVQESHVEDLKNKLQLERELRQLMQVELEKLKA